MPQPGSHPEAAEDLVGRKGEGSAVSCYPEVRTDRNADACRHPIQVLPLTEEDLTLRTAGTSRTDPSWLSPEQSMGAARAGRPLGWGPSSATTMLRTERAKSVLSVHPHPCCPWECEKAGPWVGAMSSV